MTPTGQPPKHDDREIDARAIVRMAAGLTVITVGVLGVAWFTTSWLTGEEKVHHAAPPPIAARGPTGPAEPRLQPAPPLDLDVLRAEEEQALLRYRWVDKNAGVVGLPIDRAMELVVQRGLPARAEPFPASTFTQPTQSSLGDRKAGEP
jgi:hypothetical protein